MKDVILVISIISLIVLIFKYLDVKKDLLFFDKQYKKIRKQYVELHSKFYEPIYSIENGIMNIEWKLKDKFKEDINNG